MKKPKLRKWQQPTLTEWDCIKMEIERTKIKRYPYNKILGCSLTHFIHLLKENGLSSHQVFMAILRDEEMKKYLNNNQTESDKIKHNIWVSVCARFSEINSYNNRKKCKLSRG